MSTDLELIKTLGNLLRSAGDELLKHAQRGLEEESATSAPFTGPEVKFMPVSHYAARVGRSRKTVKKWVDAGLPCVPGPRGVLVDVKPADQWLVNGGLRLQLDD